MLDESGLPKYSGKEESSGIIFKNENINSVFYPAGPCTYGHSRVYWEQEQIWHMFHVPNHVLHRVGPTL